MKKKLISLLLFSILFISVKAQTEGYRFYSTIDSVKTSGFYNIVLAPPINAHLKTDYSDVRILDNKNKWVPHVFHSPLNEMNREVVMLDLKFTIPESNKINTVLLMEAAQPLNNINILIKNTEVQKFCTLSGSNDKQNWFVISDSILLAPHPTEINTESNLKIDFPRSNYSNLKLVINNRNKDPFDVIGISTNTIATGFLFTNFSDSLLQNHPTVLLQKDSGKNSYIRIIQQQKFHFNKMNINAEGLKYFSRQADLYVAENNSNSFSNPGKFIQSFTISNNSALQFNLPLLNADTFYLVIHNEDNPPLKISKVGTSVSYRYITAYLENDKGYKLILDNAAAVLPNYDITKDYPTIKDSVSILGIGNIIAFESKEKTKNKTPNKQWLIWIAIIAALGLLLFFTKTMLKEVNKKTIDDNI